MKQFHNVTTIPAIPGTFLVEMAIEGHLHKHPVIAWSVESERLKEDGFLFSSAIPVSAGYDNSDDGITPMVVMFPDGQIHDIPMDSWYPDVTAWMKTKIK